MVNLSAFIGFHALRTPDREALTYTGQRTTYREFLNRILRMAVSLDAKGVGEGDVVAVFMKNTLFTGMCTADLLVAVVDETLEMAQQAAELLEGRQPLPAQGAEPGGQEAAGRPPRRGTSRAGRAAP